MKQSHITRRDFTKLTTAAFGGMVAGSLAGCQQTGDDGKTTGSDPAILAEKHACRGLNTCKSKGAGQNNDCAGQGTCATAKQHDCATMNDCKGQGGCGEKPAQNSCKGQGKCGVPIGDADVWQKARAAFEKAYQDKYSKAAGAAPAG